MENEHDVACHALISNNDLLTSIDDKVTTLVESALLGILSDFTVIIVKTLKLAEIGAHHNRNLSEEDKFLLLLNRLLANGFNKLFLVIIVSKAIFGTFKATCMCASINDFNKLFSAHSHVNLSRVGEISETCFMREYGLIALISLLNSREVVDDYVTEVDLIPDVIDSVFLFLSRSVLGLHFNPIICQFTHYLLDALLQELVV